MKALSPAGLAQIAVANGATSPNPGYPAIAWSTTLGLPVVWTGTYWAQVTGGSGAIAQTVTVDFGSDGVTVLNTTVAVGGAPVGARVIATPSLDMPAGVSVDEMEMEPLNCSARVQSAGVVQLIITAGCIVTGQRNINIIIG